MRGINDAGVEYLARGIDDGDLAARAVAGVKADGHAAFDGRLHQKLTEVYGEHLNGVVARFFGQLRTNSRSIDGKMRRPYASTAASRTTSLHAELPFT